MREDIIEYCAVDILEDDMFLDSIFDDSLLGVCFDANNGFNPAYDLNSILKKIEFQNKITEELSIIELNGLIEKYPMISFIKYLNEPFEELSKYNDEMFFLNGYDENSLVGVCFRHGKKIVSVYNDYLCIRSLIDRDGMDESDAVEYFEYNTRGAYVGDNTPMFLTLL
jgi:hypothetical protein